MGSEERFLPNGEIETKVLAAGTLDLREKPADLIAAQQEAEEFNYFELRDLIANLRRKGLDATEYVVDLHLKLAVPFIGTIMALLAIPLGLRPSLRSGGFANSVGLELVIGFSYWVVLALSVSLGHSSALPSALAAWTANGIFAGIGLFLLLGVN